MRKNCPRIHDGENYKGNVLIKCSKIKYGTRIFSSLEF